MVDELTIKFNWLSLGQTAQYLTCHTCFKREFTDVIGSNSWRRSAQLTLQDCQRVQRRSPYSQTTSMNSTSHNAFLGIMYFIDVIISLSHLMNESEFCSLYLLERKGRNHRRLDRYQSRRPTPVCGVQRRLQTQGHPAHD